MGEDDRVLLTVGQLARRSGQPARTIRFWSDAGVLVPAGRSGRGYRLYDPECVDRALYLPKSWTGDAARCAAAGVP